MHNKFPRLLWRAASVGIAASVLFAACKRTAQPPAQPPQADQKPQPEPEQKPVVMRTIEGQVFIRTKGAETFKLSLVNVLIFDRRVLEENVGEKRKSALPLDDYLRPLAKQDQEEYDRADKAVIAVKNEKGYDPWGRATEARNKILERITKLRHAADYTGSASYYFSDLPEPLQTTKTDADGKFSFKVPSGSYALAAVSSRKVGESTELYYWMVKVAADADNKVILANDNLCSAGSADSLISARDDYRGNATKGGIHFVEAFIENDKRERAAAELARKQVLEAAQQEPAKQAQIAGGAKEEMERRNDPKAAKLRAIELYPDLGVVDSPLYTEFRGRETIYRIEKKEFFAEPDWPTRLAKECSEALAAKPVPK